MRDEPAAVDPFDLTGVTSIDETIGEVEDP